MQRGSATSLAKGLFDQLQSKIECADDPPNLRFLYYYEYAADFFCRLEHDPSVATPVVRRLSWEHPSYPRHMQVLCRNIGDYFKHLHDQGGVFDADEAIKRGPYEPARRARAVLKFFAP